MKLHLPKLLLTAVLAACVAPAAWGGEWVANTGGFEDCYTFTGENDATSLDTTGHIGSNGVWVRAKAADITATLTELMLVNGAKLNITGTWNNSTNHFDLLTINTLKIGENSQGTGSLEIANNVDASTDIPLQTIKINAVTGTLNGISVLKNGKLITTSTVIRDKVANGTVISVNGGTLELTRTENKNINKSITVTNQGTLTLGSTDIVDENATTTFTIDNSTMAVGGSRIALGANNKIILNNGKITGNGDPHGALDYSGSATLQATGDSSIAGAIRLRDVSLTLDVTNETDTLTVANIVQADNYTGGIIKDGDGTLIIKALEAKGSNSSSRSVYKGNTEIKAGAIKYDLSANASYIGTVFGTGNIIKAGTANLILAKVSNLDGNISVTDGTLTITALEADKTLGVSVTQGKTLNIGSVTVDPLTHKLDLISKTGDSYYTNDGSSQTTNGFMSETATYRLFDGYVWNGSVTGYTVGEQDGDTTLSTNGAGTVYYVNEGTHTVSTAGDYINGRATRYFVDEGATLKIDGNQSDGMTAADILTTSTGAGNIELTTDVTLAAGSSTSVGGTLSVSNATIKVDTTGTHNDIKVLTTSLASFNKVSLDGATIEYLGATSELQNVTVGTAGANLKFKDMAAISSEFKLTGTTLLNGNLTIGQTTGDAWKYTVHISKLTGSGDISLSSTATSGQTGEKGKLIIDSLQGYTGAISVTKNVGPALLTATTGGAVSLKGITLASGAEGTVITTGNAGLGNVSLSGGASLDIWKKSASLTTTISSLSVTGSATVGTERHSSCHNGTFNISSLSNTGDSATLTLKNGSQTDSATVFNLSGSSALKGTINIQSDSYRGDDNDDDNVLNMKRKLQVNLNSVEVGSKAVINFQDASDTTGKNGEGSANNVRANYNILGVGVDGAKVAGLSGTTTNAATIKSSTEDATRTLEITGSGNNTTNATVENSVKLLMSGSGQQTFTGTVNASAITVTAGELVFNNEVSVAEVSVTGGTLTVGTYDGTTGALTTEQSLTATNKATFGAGAVVNANLVLSSGATVTMAEALTMGSTLTLSEGMTLSGDLVSTIKGMSKDGAVDLFTGVDALYLGNATVASATLDATSGVNLSEYFNFDGASNYYLGYNGTKVFAGVIPEPTTATLSLLALAGLAARRRRK